MYDKDIVYTLLPFLYSCIHIFKCTWKSIHLVLIYIKVYSMNVCMCIYAKKVFTCIPYSISRKIYKKITLLFNTFKPAFKDKTENGNQEIHDCVVGMYVKTIFSNFLEEVWHNYTLIQSYVSILFCGCFFNLWVA